MRNRRLGACRVAKMPIGAAPECFLTHMLNSWAAIAGYWDDRAFAADLDNIADPAGIVAACADYRANASIDLLHDTDDEKERRVVSAPALLIWGQGP